MTLNVGESHAVLRIIDHLTGQNAPNTHPVTREAAIDALTLLADGASKRLLVGSGQQARTTLEQHWPTGAPAGQPMPQPPAPGHVVPADGRPDPSPFDWDFDAAEKRHHLRVRDHWNDTTPPWPLERLREYAQLSDTLPGHTDASPRWQETNARVADIRGTFEHIARLERQIREAHELASELFTFLHDTAEGLPTLAEWNPDLTEEHLPSWLTGDPNAPAEWQTPYANEEAQREAGMDATYEHDPDYGKDLDYDDEDA